MKYLLSAASHPILERLARERTLCAFDFDGTLSPIVDRPDQAGMRTRTRQLLTRLAGLYPCLILTGRGRQDMLERMKEVGIVDALGSHGAESKENEGQPQHQIAVWRIALEAGLKATPGIWVEDKGHSLAVHYRQYPRKAEAKRQIQKIINGFGSVQVIGGKEVINVMEAGAPNKGTALIAQRDRLGADWVIYIGDDDNDEDAFAVEGNVVPVRVGRKVRSAARYFLRSQSEIDRLLNEMIRLREQSLGIPETAAHLAGWEK